MPLFGHEKRDAENEKLRREVERLGAMSLQQVAAEVMTRGFGPGGPGAEGATPVEGIVYVFNPASISVGLDDDALNALHEIVAEGVQALEHACLVRSYLAFFDRSSNVSVAWTSTRLGRAALQQSGAIERVLAGGGL